MNLKKYIGNKNFYKMVILLIIPLIIQQGITNFVNLLDNLMVGSLGTEPMSGVAIVNQLIFVFNLTIFGGLSGASIFGAQFYGMGDHDGMRHTFRFKMIFGIIVTIAAIIVFSIFGVRFVTLFLNNDSNSSLDLTATLGYAQDYMRIILWGIAPFMVVQVYAGTLRETGETMAPMIASVIAICLNLVGNYLLIYGHFGFPKMGVSGAALATIISRYVEMLYVVVYTHRSSGKYKFIHHAYSSFRVPLPLAGKICRTGTPLLLNELLWSLATTFINQNYSTRGLSVVAASNITSTAWQLFCIIMFAMGNAVAILVGQKLGAGKPDEAKDINRKLIAFTFVSNIFIGAVIVLCAPYIPRLYNTEREVMDMATKMLIIAGIVLPVQSIIHASYFAIRAGGKTVVTFFFDCVYTWCIPAVLSYFLCRHTLIDIVTVYAIIQFSDTIKFVIAMFMIRSGFWTKNIIG